MKLATLLPLSALSLAALAAMPVALADSADATCQVRKDGETKHGASGPCTFSQRQGYVDIDLRNGDTVSMSPTNQPNHYRDQSGKTVVRTVSGNTQEYKWEHRKIVVTFVQGSGYNQPQQQHQHNKQSGGEVGQTPRDLIDIQNSMLVGGEVEEAMNQRGYKQVKSDTTGEEMWSYYRSRSSGQCVVVHLDAERQIQSIVNALPSSCQ
jgi:hypothetical protein